MISTLLSEVTAAGAGAPYDLAPGARGLNYSRGAGRLGVVQVVLTGTAVVALQGSLNGTDWSDIAEFTSGAIAETILPRYIRGNVTSRTSGTVTVLVEHGAGL